MELLLYIVGGFVEAKENRTGECGDSMSSPNLKQLTCYMVLCNSQPFWNSRNYQIRSDYKTVF